jgi:hypothetical protein
MTERPSSEAISVWRVLTSYIVFPATHRASAPAVVSRGISQPYAISRAIDRARLVTLFDDLERGTIRVVRSLPLGGLRRTKVFGLGIEVQRASVPQHFQKQTGKLVAEFTEIK